MGAVLERDLEHEFLQKSPLRRNVVIKEQESYYI